MKDLSTLFPHYLIKLFAQTAAPKWLVAILLGTLDYLLPSIAPSVALAAGGLVLLDTISGLVRARVTGQEVTSAKMGRFLTKSFSYSVAILTIAFAVHIIPNTVAFQPAAVTTLITGIAVTESYSIFENLKAMGYTPPKGVTDLLNRLFDSIASRKDGMK